MLGDADLVRAAQNGDTVSLGLLLERPPVVALRSGTPDPRLRSAGGGRRPRRLYRGRRSHTRRDRRGMAVTRTDAREGAGRLPIGGGAPGPETLHRRPARRGQGRAGTVRGARAGSVVLRDLHRHEGRRSRRRPALRPGAALQLRVGAGQTRLAARATPLAIAGSPITRHRERWSSSR